MSIRDLAPPEHLSCRPDARHRLPGALTQMGRKARLGQGVRTRLHAPPRCYGNELRKGLHRQYAGSLNGTVDNRCRDLVLHPPAGSTA
jgi:hypothetical protein